MYYYGDKQITKIIRLGEILYEVETGITGTAPVLAAMTEGDTLDDAVTWGTGFAPDGETMTGGSPTREMQIDGGAWEAYVGATAPAAGATVAVRELWATIEGSTRTFTSGTQVVAALGALLFDGDPLVFDGDPLIFNAA